MKPGERTALNQLKPLSSPAGTTCPASAHFTATSHFHQGRWFKTDMSIFSIITNTQCLKRLKKAKISRVDVKAYRTSKTPRKARLGFPNLHKAGCHKTNTLIFFIRLTAVPWPHHHPATGRTWLIQPIHGESWRKETWGDLFCCNETMQTQLWGTMCSLAHAHNTRAQFYVVLFR